MKPNKLPNSDWYDDSFIEEYRLKNKKQYLVKPKPNWIILLIQKMFKI